MSRFIELYDDTGYKHIVNKHIAENVAERIRKLRGEN